MQDSVISEHSEHDHAFEWAEIARIVFVALAAAAVWFRLWEPFPHISVIGIAATLIGGYPILKEAFENIAERKMTMELFKSVDEVLERAPESVHLPAQHHVKAPQVNV